MIGMLSGNKETVKAFNGAVGKSIKALGIDDDQLVFTFIDGSKIALFDDGQSCCEHRWMHTDDDLDDFIGATLRGAEVRDGPTDSSNEYGDLKESQFLIVSTSLGQFTVVNYNEHNGYYGGFSTVCREVVE